MTRRLALGVVALAVGCERDASVAPTSGVARGPDVPAAARALAQSFDPAIVGTLVPVTPVAGDYALALELDFVGFASAELRIVERQAATVQLSLAADGTARACLSAAGDHITQGQYGYKPVGVRAHSERKDARRQAYAGRWTVVEGVAVIHFDRTAADTCDATAAVVAASPPSDLRCIGIGATTRVPVGGLACDAGERSAVLEAGMPLERDAPGLDHGEAPRGHRLVLGAPGVLLDIGNDGYGRGSTYTFKAGVVTLAPGAAPAPTR